ncbi:MAG: fused MFS/spermidine synthase, partial [Geodermatophilaceae bacterium]|nr:fused MFS/spermidine synthase [Geodermatophilaceae bacterium]
LTLARYVAQTRPGSRQRAFDSDVALIDLVRRELPLRRTARVTVRPADAREGLATLAPGSADVVVSDVFRGARTPAALTSREFFTDVARVLRPGGVCAVNLGDGPPLTFSRSLTATVGAVFAHVCLMGDPAVLRERRYGNLVCLGSARPLPLPALTRRTAGDPAPARVVAGPDLDRFVGRARVIDDTEAVDSPAPPAGLFDKPPR